MARQPESLEAPSSVRHRNRSTKVTAFVMVLLLLGVAVFVALEIAVHRAAPVLRARVIQTLSTRFDSRVELGEFHVSVLNGLSASGADLALYPNHLSSPSPLIAVKHFRFAAGWRDLLKTPMQVGTVEVDGLSIHLPPKEQRANIPRLGDKQENTKGQVARIQVARIDVRNTTLVLGASKPGKDPIEFDIGQINLTAQPSGMPWAYEATLVNPKPVGDIHAVGRFGPWQAGSPGDTPLDGDYSFSHADLGGFKGIAGILSSTGKFFGVLDNITVDGQTDTPDFRLERSGNPVPLNTTFHATVDGTNGDTHLHPVEAHLLKSHFTATGDVVRVPGQEGHQISLDVVVDNGRIEDFLRLAVHGEQPLLKGAVQIKSKLNIPPGKERVINKLGLNGTFVLRDAHFTNTEIQSKLDALSMRSQGQPKKATDNIPDNVTSEMQGHFTLANSRMTLSGLEFDVPGANISMQGTYSLDGNQLDMHGKARLQAHLSQMVTGWKSWLLKPVDPFFAKNGAGTEVPFKVTGTRSDMKFGLDFHHKDERDDLKTKDTASSQARRAPR